MLLNFGLSDEGQQVGIAAGLAPAANDGSGFPVGLAVSGEERNGAVEDGFAESGRAQRHDRARSVSFGIICICFCIWGRSMKRFIDVSLSGLLGLPTARRAIIFGGFLGFPVRAYTIGGHVGAVLASIPAMGALLTGGRVGINETGFCEL